MWAGCWHFNCCHPDLLWRMETAEVLALVAHRKISTLATAARAMLLGKLIAAGLLGSHLGTGQIRIWTCSRPRLVTEWLFYSVELVSTLWLVADCLGGGYLPLQQLAESDSPNCHQTFFPLLFPCILKY